MIRISKKSDFLIKNESNEVKHFNQHIFERRKDMGYIWQNNDWPDFTVDVDKLRGKYESYLYQKGRTDQIFNLLTPKSQNEFFSDTIASDIVASNEIEGISVSYESVYSSVAKALHIETDLKGYDRNAEALAALALSVRNDLGEIDKDKILSWHRKLFEFAPKTAKNLVPGEFRRKPVYVMRFSGRMEEEVLYEAVPAEHVDEEIDSFVNWIKNNSENYPPVVRSAVASLRFVSIHPFPDGNGRMSRLISDALLSGGLESKYFSSSSEILLNKKEYYAKLYDAQHSESMDCTPYVSWFIDICTEGMQKVENICSQKIRLSSFMASLDPCEFNSREITMLYKLASGAFKGKLTPEKWCKMTKCTSATATRDLAHLVEKNILLKAGHYGRSQSYLLNPEAAGNLSDQFVGDNLSRFD